MGLLLIFFGLWCLLLAVAAIVYRLVQALGEAWRGRRCAPPADHHPSSRRPALLSSKQVEANRQRWGRDLSGKRYESIEEFVADEHRGIRR